MTPAGKAEVLARMAVAYVHLDRAEEGLRRVQQALPYAKDPVPVLAVQAWIKMFTNPPNEALSDCITVLELCRKQRRADYSLFSAIINACNILSYETCPANPSLYDRLQAEVNAYRKTLSAGGSNYRNVQRPRLMLSRAEVLILMRLGREAKARVLLRRSANGLREDHPNDAFESYVDLFSLLSKIGKEQETAEIATITLTLLDRISWKVGAIARHALQAISEAGTVSYGQAMEIKMLLRSRRPADATS